MKKIVLIFVIFLAAIFFVGIFRFKGEAQVTNLVKKDTVLKQDTLRKNISPVKLTYLQKKEQEYKEWQARFQKINKNFETLDKQSALMDSLIGKKRAIQLK